MWNLVLPVTASYRLRVTELPLSVTAHVLRTPLQNLLGGSHMNGKEIGYGDDMGTHFAFVVQLDGGHYVICEDDTYSDESPSFEYGTITVGPAATMGGLFDELYVDREKHSREAKLAFVDAIERSNKETLDATRKALGL
jgi:hypothetical protein